MRRTGFALVTATALALSGITLSALAHDLLEPAQVTGLSKADLSGFREVYAKQGVDFSRYTQISVAPLAWAEGSDKRRDDDVAKITPYNRDYLARRWAEITKDRFGEIARLTENATDPATLVIEAKMLTARPNRTPYDMREMGLMNALIFGVGSAGMQINVRDGKTGALLMVLADRREGENFRDNFNLAFFWGDTEQCMRRWAQALTEALPVAGKPAKAS